MNAPVQMPATKPQATSLFRMPDGRNLFITFVLVTSLFLLWGFCNGMIDILNKHFQDSLHINKEQSGLVQFANYLAYFLMAIPAGLIARKFGYKGGILVGLTLICAGSFWFIPAIGIGAYWAFLLGLFIIAAGMTCLETIANPYTTVLGPPESGATRINIAQTINGLGWILGPIVGGQLVLSGGTGANANAGLRLPYLGIGVFVLVLLVVFIFSKIPDLRTQDERPASAEQKKRVKPSGGQTAVIAVVLAIVCLLLYFFIAPILALVWALLDLTPAVYQQTEYGQLALPRAYLQPTEYGLLVVAFIAAFILVVQNWDMFRRKHFTLGIGAQFLYVAAQTGVFSFFVNYVLENDPGVNKVQASKMLGAIGFVLFASGRLFGSAAISKMKPHLVLAAYAAINVVLTAICMGGGTMGLYALYGTFFFMSVMFPTIFALGIRGLGDYTKLGASLIVMSIVGGAIAAPFMGHVADTHGSPTFLADDITDVPSFALKLTDKPDDFSKFLVTQMSDAVAAPLTVFNATKANPTNAQAVINSSNLQAVLAIELNKVISGPSLVGKAPLKNVQLRSATYEMVKLNPQGTNVVQLNRMLLEDAYPQEMTTNHRGGMRVGFAVPLVCFIFIALYGAFWQKLETKDITAD